MYTITVYSDNFFKTKILERANTSNSAIIEGIEYDLLDGADWWKYDLEDIEKELNGEWEKAIFISDSRSDWRIISRNYFLGKEEIDSNYSIAAVAYLFSESNNARTESLFSSHLIDLHGNIDYSNLEEFQEPFSTNHIFQKINIFLGLSETEEEFDLNQLKRTYCTKVYQPSAASLTAAKLTDEYQSIVYFSGYSDLKFLEDGIEDLKSLLCIRNEIIVQQRKLEAMRINQSEISNIFKTTENEIQNLIRSVRNRIFI